MKRCWVNDVLRFIYKNTKKSSSFPFLSEHTVDRQQTHLDGSSGKVGKLFDVLTLLADQGPDCLSWNKEVDNLLFWSLLLKKDHTEKKKFKVLLLNFTIF